MKKTTAILLSALIIISVFVNAFATEKENIIYADAVTVEGGEQITIPVKIEKNSGFMGFAIIVTYDEGVMTPVSVSKGTMLSGMFNDSIETSTDNTFRVVFSGTSDIVSNGVLFNAVFDVSDGFSGDYEIELSYSQQDTFKENWSNAVFDCENISVVVTENGTTAAPVTTQPTTTAPAESSTKPVEEPNAESTTKPIKETSTQPSTEPTTKPSEKPVGDLTLSQRIIIWLESLPSVLSILLGIFVRPIAWIISIFE